MGCDQGGAGPLRMPGFAINAHQGARRKPPPMLGEHTYEVLIALGYSAQQIEALAAAGAVGLRVSKESMI